MHGNRRKRNVSNLVILSRKSAVSNRMDIRQKKVISAEVTETSDTNFYCGFFSQGIYVETWETLPLGTRLRVNIEIEDLKETFEVEGQVRLIKTEDGIDDDLNSGMGIEFLCLTDSQEKTIARFCEVRQPMFYDYDPA